MLSHAHAYSCLNILFFFFVEESKIDGPLLRKNVVKLEELKASASYEVQILVNPFGKGPEERAKANFTLGNVRYDSFGGNFC